MKARSNRFELIKQSRSDARANSINMHLFWIIKAVERGGEY